MRVMNATIILLRIKLKLDISSPSSLCVRETVFFSFRDKFRGMRVKKKYARAQGGGEVEIETRDHELNISQSWLAGLIISFLTSSSLKSLRFFDELSLQAAPGNSHIYSILASATAQCDDGEANPTSNAVAGCVLSRIKAIHSRRSTMDDYGGARGRRKLNVRINSWFAVGGDSNLASAIGSMMSRSKTDIWLYLFYSL